MAQRSEIVDAFRAGEDMTVYRIAYDSLCLEDFMKAFHCSSRTAKRIFGKNKNRKISERNRSIGDRIAAKEVDRDSFFREWCETKNEKEFCERWGTSPKTLKKMFGARKEMLSFPKETWLDRYRREQKEKQEEAKRFSEQSEREYGETYYELGNCVTPVLSSNIRICSAK